MVLDNLLDLTLFLSIQLLFSIGVIPFDFINNIIKPIFGSLFSLVGLALCLVNSLTLTLASTGRILVSKNGTANVTP